MLMLTRYNLDFPIEVATYASVKVIGAYICHSSGTLTDAEINYSHIEK